MSEAGNNRYTVLVVDDDPDLLHLLADGLELLGNFNVVSATNGIEGLERFFELRPDCMIIDGDEIFWARFMEGGLPSCRPGSDGTQHFCGIYGTRFVEFLTIRRFDDMDRMPEVMSAHLKDAMRQLWMVPH